MSHQLDTVTEITATAVPDALAPAVVVPPGPNSFWELYERIDPVAVCWRASDGRLRFSEQNSARRLLKELREIGAEGVTIVGVISDCGALDRSSLRALNCYLRHVLAVQSERQMSGRYHRFTWYELQRAIGFRWLR